MDQVLIEISKPIVKKSWKEIVFAKGLDSHIEDLKECKASIEARLGDVDSLGSCSRSQQYVLDKLRQEHDRILDFFEERATRVKQRELVKGSMLTHVRLFFSPSNTFVARFRDAQKVKDISKKLDHFEKCYSQLASNPGTFLNMVTGKKTQPETGPFPDTDLIVGRDGERDILISKLCNSSTDQDSLSVFTIVGIGGQGKTTLAQYVYNDQRVMDCFEVRLWVFATPDDNLRELLEKIIADATDEKPFNCEMSQLHRRIEKSIKGKKFLLVLDNMWDQDKLKENWQGLRRLLKFGATGSKVLVTTRCKEVARIMGPLEPYMLNDLAEKEAWLLFQHFAFNQRQESGTEAIGEGIFKICPKIPLVLKVVGQHLEAECQTIDQWKAFKDDLDKQSSFKGHDMIMETLKFSYDRLYEKLKPCVSYCSLFPKGIVYDVDQLVRIWIALGYIEGGNKSLEDVGQEYVQMLANRGFFEYVEDVFGRFLGFKMHDVIHDLILSESKSQYKMVDSETTKIHENICHVSFCTGIRYTFHWDAPGTNCTIKSRLKSILLVPKNGNTSTCGCWKHFASSTFRYQSQYYCDQLISKFQDLKVLDIHEMLIEKVPRSLGKLIHLGYLDLSGNEMQKLPNSITQLVNLLSLDLSNCKNLQELPKDMSRLYKMRHLSLYGCGSLTHMPKGLGKMKDLQTLGLFIVGEDKGNVTGGLEELGDLKNLRGELTIIVKVESKYIVSQGRTPHFGRKDKLTALNIEFWKSAKEDEMVLEALRPQGNELRRMKTFNYGGKRLPSWMLNHPLHCELPSLVDIWITNYKASMRNKVKEPELNDQPWLRVELLNEHHLVECIPGFSELKKQLMMAPREVGFKMSKGDGSRGLTLRSLTIARQLATFPSLQQQHPPLLFNTWFPNLEELQICGIPELEHLPEEFRDLSFLTRLVISACPKLKAIPDWISTLTSLKEIIIENCPHIETLPHQISTLPYLEEIFMPDFSENRIITPSNKATSSSWPKRLWRDAIVASAGPSFKLGVNFNMRLRLIACMVGGSPFYGVL